MKTRATSSVLTLAVLVLLLGGCASGPYVDPQALGLSEAECAILEVPTTSRHFSQIGVYSLDGIKTGSVNQLILAPGSHDISLTYNGRTMSGAHLSGGERGGWLRNLFSKTPPLVLRFDAAAGRRYHVFAHRGGNQWAASIIDTLAGEQVSRPVAAK